MKNIAVLGSTGSIGTQTLDIVRRHPKKLKVMALVANSNVELLKKQIEEFQPELVVLADASKGAALQKNASTKVLLGEENIVHAATLDQVDMVINALVGKAGLIPTIEAIKLSKQIGLANKETLVLAGELVMKLAKKHGAPILPIDSEHSALFQALQMGKRTEVKRLILTMGKGPIAAMTPEELKSVTMQDIFKRPKWDMGGKISVDSATCVNKAFEVIEARWLFDLLPEQIEIVVHPEYICHSLVEFVDGSILTELGTADMRRYIQYALFYPERVHSPKDSFINLFDQSLTFEEPPFAKFPCLSLGHQVLKSSGTMPAVFHGADSYAVQAFMEGKILFTDIAHVIEEVMSAHANTRADSIADILAAERWAEQYLTVVGVS